MRRAVVAGGTILVGGFLFAGLPKIAIGGSSDQDVEILNFALSLEYLQEAFYDEALQRADLSDDLQRFTEVVVGHERTHIRYLTDFLGERADQRPTFDFGDALRDEESFAATAVMLEDLGVAAYNGQANNLSRETLREAAKIVSVDARHAAWIRALVGQRPAAEPTDDPMTANEVREAIEQTGFVQ